MVGSNPSSLERIRDTSNLCEGRLAEDEAIVFERFHSLFDLRGRVVVEVGGCLPTDHCVSAGVTKWWSIDPRNSPASSAGVVHSIRGVASSIPLPDKNVDYVFSCNAFHHISDLRETLTELSRVLRPGGYVYANFGPIWSGPDGSHIEALTVNNRRYDFWTDSLLPSWSHLIFDERELTTLLRVVHSEELASAVGHYVFHSQWINRLTLTDYIEAFQQSRMKVIFMGGSREIGYCYQPPDISHPLMDQLQPARLASKVRERYQLDEFGMQVRDIELILRNV